MSGRLLRVTGTVLVIAVAFLTPVLVTSTPASADTVLNGCTIVSNPTPTNFTNCPGVNLSTTNLTGVDFSYANLAGALLVQCSYTIPQELAAECTIADLFGANLTDANLSNATFFGSLPTLTGPVSGLANLSGVTSLSGADLSGDDLASNNLSDANLTGANLTGANLTGATLAKANLTDANFTGTILVPSNQTATATSQSGTVVTWPTPAGIPGATPGSCAPASGSTFPLFGSTVTCQVLDNNGDVATGTFQVDVNPTTQFFTRVLVPSDGAVLSGSPYLDAGAADAPAVTSVVFEVSGGTLNNQVVSASGRTIFGWLGQWNTTSVPNDTYTLQSVATDADGNTDTSDPITVTVDNPPPTTTVGLPSNGATVTGGTFLDASASAGVASVSYELTGGAFNDTVISGSTPTIVGWLGGWDSTTVTNGTYTLQSVACYPGGVCGTSAPVTVTVAN